MLVNESIEDVLKGKTDDEVKKDFKEKYGIEYSEIRETVERMRSVGVDARLDSIENHEGTRYPIIVVYRYEIKMGHTEFQSSVLGTTMTKEAAQEIIDVMKNKMNIGEVGKEYAYSVGKETFNYMYSNRDALKILAKIINEG
jgi:hypothetical protein